MQLHNPLPADIMEYMQPVIERTMGHHLDWRSADKVRIFAVSQYAYTAALVPDSVENREFLAVVRDMLAIADKLDKLEGNV